MAGFIPKPPFPNVPQLPGVPQLPRSNTFPPGPPPALNSVIAVGRLLLALTTKAQWGIYRIPPPLPPAPVPPDGVLPEVVVTPPNLPVLVPDNFRRLDYGQEWSITDAPLQNGAFASFNKVASPYDITLRMAKGGTLASRREFLEKLESIGTSLDMFRIVTPERTYNNCNIQGFRVVREDSRGAYFLDSVDVTFREVRTVTAQYTSTAANTVNAQNPSAEPVNNLGTLNAATPASRVSAAVDRVLAPLRRVASIIGAG